MFALEMLCCGFTIASIILIESSDVKISLWFAAIPLAISIPDGEENKGFTHLVNDDWEITNIE